MADSAPTLVFTLLHIHISLLGRSVSGDSHDSYIDVWETRLICRRVRDMTNIYSSAAHTHMTEV